MEQEREDYADGLRPTPDGPATEASPPAGEPAIRFDPILTGFSVLAAVPGLAVAAVVERSGAEELGRPWGDLVIGLAAAVAMLPLLFVGWRLSRSRAC